MRHLECGSAPGFPLDASRIDRLLRCTLEPGLIVFAIAWTLVPLLLGSPANVSAPAAPPLRLAELPPDNDLAAFLWDRSPDLLAARARTASTRAEVVRASTLPNPALDASWNTIPVGESNPPGLEHPLANTPNYAFGLSWLVEIGKRAPRKDAAAAAADATSLDAAELLRRQLIDLLESIARVASSEQRIAALDELVSDAARLTELQRKRADHGDTAELDVERVRLEEVKLHASLAEERQKLAGALIDCSRIAGGRCEPFADAGRAHAFLAARADLPASAEILRQAIAKRPDLLSLAAQERSARAALELARARGIPDPTFRAGFVYDTFLVSGNQGKSFFLGASIPLPFFERGKADAAQAVAAATASKTARALLQAQAERDLDGELQQADELARRRATMTEKTVPMAQSVVRRLTAALGVGGASLQDVLQARRTLGEILEDGADLDLTSVEVSLSIARIAGVGPPGLATAENH